MKPLKMTLMLGVGLLYLNSQAQLIAQKKNLFPHDSKELESFLDSVICIKMKEYNIPGVLITVVKDDKLFLSKGYGYADVENKVRVDAKKTIVRAMSVSKPFTAMAVMKNVEMKKLDLDKDVNNYLTNFKIKLRYSQPVTLAQLLTHQAGFVDDNTYLLAKGEIRNMTLGNWLKTYMPARVNSSDSMKYSNYGSSLAGYIVEQQYGMDFREYMQKHILTPLKMKSSSFYWPKQLPDKMFKRVAIGYYTDSLGKMVRMDDTESDFANTPAANLLTTGHDIANFMIMTMNKGIFNDKVFLSDTIMSQIYYPWKYYNLREDVGLGFFWLNVNGKKVLFHGGGWTGSLCSMEMIPSEKIGFFLWYNMGGDTRRKLRLEFEKIFFNHIFPD
jgi:CubicO group peptidase (beta-lactamase class C family)